MKTTFITLALLTFIFSIFAVVAQDYPPFTQGGTADTVIVIGSQDDMVAAENIQSFLRGGLNEEGNFTETMKFQRASNRLYLGDNLTDLRGPLLTDSDLPDLLADQTFETDDGDEFDYRQRIDLAQDLQFTVFQDNDYHDDDPSIGVFVQNGQHILNYTLDFQDNARSDIEDSRLPNFENSNLRILGKDYTIISANTNDHFELVSGAEKDILNVGESKTYTINNSQYTVELNFVDTNNARFTVNGATTRSLQEGDTQEVAGVTIAVTQIDFQNFQGGIQQAEFILGAEKIILENDREVEIGNAGETVEGLNVYIQSTQTTDTYELQKITLSWDAQDDLFAAVNAPADHQIVMPGFENLKIFMTEFVTPAQEELLIQNRGSDEMGLEVFVTDSDNSPFRLPILSTDGGGTITSIGGRGGGDKLATSGNDTVLWDDDTDNYLVASWNDNSISESYILELDVGTFDGNDVVDFRNQVTGDMEEENVEVGEEVNIGELSLTVESIDRANQQAVISTGSGGSFNKLFTKEGLLIYLPVSSATYSGSGAITLGTASSWDIELVEENEDEDVAAGQSFSFTIAVDQTDDKIEVQDLNNASQILAGGIFDSLEENSDLVVGWIQSPLASKIELDEGPNQPYATVIYHGGESYGDVYLGAGSENITNVIQILFDDEVPDDEDMNLIVVGGSCVNRVAARLIGVNFPTCGENWETITGVGANQAIIETYTSPYDSGKVATLVAGYERADTLRASNYFIDNQPTILVGRSEKV